MNETQRRPAQIVTRATAIRGRSPVWREDVIPGAILGVVFGVWNIAESIRHPLADDSPVALLSFYGPMFAAWGVAGFLAARRQGRLADGVKAGMWVALVTFVVFWLANLLRVNLFLETVRYRDDWRSLVARFEASGFQSLRAYANYEYLRGAPLKIFVPAMIGAVTGFLGGLLALVKRP